MASARKQLAEFLIQPGVFRHHPLPRVSLPADTVMRGRVSHRSPANMGTAVPAWSSSFCSLVSVRCPIQLPFPYPGYHSQLYEQAAAWPDGQSGRRCHRRGVENERYIVRVVTEVHSDGHVKGRATIPSTFGSPSVVDDPECCAILAPVELKGEDVRWRRSALDQSSQCKLKSAPTLQ